MISEIEYCYLNKKISSFYCNPDDCDAHYTGFVERFNDSEILIAHITPNGYYDGYVLKRISDIYRVDYDGEYEKKIEKLYTLRAQKHSRIDTCEKNNGALLFAVLDYAKDNNLVVSLDFEDSHISGLINCYNDTIVKLCSINDNGKKDGLAIVKLDNILSIDLDTEYEQNLNILINSR